MTDTIKERPTELEAERRLDKDGLVVGGSVTGLGIYPENTSKIVRAEEQRYFMFRIQLDMVDDEIKSLEAKGLKGAVSVKHQRGSALEAYSNGNDAAVKAVFQSIHSLIAAIEKHEYVKKYKKGLTDEGRHQGGEATRKKSAAHKEHIRKAVEPLLQHNQTFDWGDGRIADWLMERHVHTFNGITIKKRQLLNHIKAIREEYKVAQKAG